jgi:hypothetical protein
MGLLCYVFGHKYKKRTTWRRVSYVLVVCDRCKKRWLMSHEHQSLLSWDDECDMIVRDLEQGY